MITRRRRPLAGRRGARSHAAAALPAQSRTVQLHDHFIPDQGLRMVGKHHEIDLRDFRKVAAEKRRTLLRQPIAAEERAPLA